MKIFGITDQVVLNIWKILAGILHLGNVTFSEAKSSSTPCGITNAQCMESYIAVLFLLFPF